MERLDDNQEQRTPLKELVGMKGDRGLRTDNQQGEKRTCGIKGSKRMHVHSESRGRRTWTSGSIGNEGSLANDPKFP